MRTSVADLATTTFATARMKFGAIVGLVAAGAIAAGCSSADGSHTTATESAQPDAVVPSSWKAGCDAYYAALTIYMGGPVSSAANLAYATALDKVAEGPARATPLAELVDSLATQLRSGTFDLGAPAIDDLCVRGILPAAAANPASQAAYLKAVRASGIGTEVTDANVIAAGQLVCEMLCGPDAETTARSRGYVDGIAGQYGGFPLEKQLEYGERTALAAVTTLCPIELATYDALP